MKNIKLIKYIFIILMFVLPNITYSNSNIYFLDMNYIMNNSLAGKSILNQLEKKKKSNFTLLGKEVDLLKKEEIKISSQKNILSKDEFEKKFQLLRKKFSDFNIKKDRINNDLSKKSVLARNKLLTEMQLILSEYAKKNDISYVVRKESIIIGKNELNLTNIIIKLMDSKIKNIKLI